MPGSKLPLRLILLAASAIGAALVIGLLVATLNSLLEFFDRVAALPSWLRLPLICVLAIAVFGAAVLAWRFLGPARRSPRGTPQAPTRMAVDARIAQLRERQAETGALEAELVELDRRRAGGEVYVALFGEISTGKSSLIRALAPDAAPGIDVLGGTTRAVAHHRGLLPDGRALILADVPGSAEVEGRVREQIARDEALRAHAVVYVCAGDLTRAQDAEIDWLVGFGKPLLIALNKIDLYGADERAALRATLQARYGARVAAIVAISAGGSERLTRTLADGRNERVERERIPQIGDLVAALGQVVGPGAQALEPAREAAVLVNVDTRAAQLGRIAAAEAAQACVVKYTRRAIVGAMAAVAPGSDIVIQGALGTGLIRELARIHGVAVRELDVDQLLRRVGLTVRNTTAIVLAIAGNALKAFPGLGTLGGGVLHAIAYGLVFDSLGRAISETLAERADLDQAETERRLRELLAEPARERIERVARLVLSAARDGARGEPPHGS